ncbi:archease [Kaarinaea lacus]
MSDHWEHFEHEADIGVRGVGTTLARAFEQAALAMTAVITDVDSVSPTTSIQIQCESADDEILFIDWLNSLIYEIATQKMLFSHYKVSINAHKLNAEVFGEQIDVAKHQPAVEIKGATFTELRVYQQNNGDWVAQCIVDV